MKTAAALLTFAVAQSAPETVYAGTARGVFRAERGRS